MTRDELIRRLCRLARRRGVEFDVAANRGKGGHWMVQFGPVRIPIPQAKRGDLAPGTLHSILGSFGLRREDVE